MDNYRLEMRNMTKIYGAVTVLDEVNFAVKAGEVHALIGENGAGKSTLLNLLSGVKEANSGDIMLEGAAVKIKNPLAARNAGIAMIHQELQHVPELSVAQNMFLGRPLTKHNGLFVDKKAQYAKAKLILRQLDPAIDPDAQIKTLKVAQQQIVEIGRALLEEAKIIAMDEPTSSLTPTEFERLAQLIHDLKMMGVSIIYVSHKMDEIFKVCDRATILRDGKQVGVVNLAEETEETLVTRMVGRKIDKIKHNTFATDREILKVENLGRNNAVKPASFSVYAGEVLGIAGLVGSGRTELLRLIAGLDKKTSGRIFINGREITSHNVRSAIQAGIGLVPEDRKKEGIIKERSVAVNMALPSMKQFTRQGLVNSKKLKSVAVEVMSSLRLRPLDIQRHIGTLSGGNQQKVIIGRWVAAKNEVFLFDEPTRGIDVGAKSEIYNLIEKLAHDGKAIIVVSSEMPEIMRISDRVLVIKDGKVAAQLTGGDISEEKIAQYALSSTVN
ncbi:sugar ABC transporter ATP-binding protein [Sodalis sp. C49]|uniref:sugar ABC transporter ATP-binding protein n=1 Tax=Sodalis sp. C49 TaxID=3228929 RepID=UPI00396592FF